MEFKKVKKFNKFIIYEKCDQIVRLTLNKPEKMNAFFFIEPESQDMIEFNAALDEAARDDSVKVLILAGAGDNFCVGEELAVVGEQYGKNFAYQPGFSASQRKRIWVDVKGFQFFEKLMWYPKVTIARVQGRSVGVGSDMVLLCDLAIASEDASISFIEESLVFGGMSFPLRILHLGPKRWRELAYTGRKLPAREAKEVGIFNTVVPLEELDKEVERWAKAVCLMPADAIALGKATSMLSYDMMGMGTQPHLIGIMHAFGTNIHFEPGEWNLFRERAKKPLREALRERNKRYKDLGFEV